MKLKIEVDIDWIGEDGMLVDDLVKQEIVNQISTRLSEKTMNEITEEVEKQITAKVDTLVNQTYEGFLNKGITVTDDWGEPIEKNIKIIDLIKKRCDKWLGEKVDARDGRKYSGFGGGITRIEFFVKNQLEKETRKITEDIVKQVEHKIKSYVTDSVKERIGENLVKGIGLEKIFEAQTKQKG